MSIRLFGLDLGQVQDYAALVGLEVTGTVHKFTYEGQRMGFASTERGEVEGLPVVSLAVRHIERFPLGTKYHAIGQKVTERLSAIPRPWCLVVDLTGVGVAAIEWILHLNPIGLTITSGGQVNWPGPAQVNCPKRELVAAMQVALQRGLLKIAAQLPNASLLTSELTTFRSKVSAAGRDTYEAWREADHDDLVLATAMPVWMANVVLARQVARVQDLLTANHVENLMRAGSDLF